MESFNKFVNYNKILIYKTDLEKIIEVDNIKYFIEHEKEINIKKITIVFTSLLFEIFKNRYEKVVNI